ncbi:hypothetical protein AB0C77_38540, partial [Streptomyces sp. NPDC048629]|uniref:hypothetical protein n=1 Tax=Streptomyces sp. NPDC048629 TaxID=3154824 RepID=UPI003425B834
MLTGQQVPFLAAAFGCAVAAAWLVVDGRRRGLRRARLVLAGVSPVRGHSNVQGDRTMGVWDRMPQAFLDSL